MRFALLAFVVLFCSQAMAAEPNTWVKLDDARIIGRRWDIPLAYSPELKTFMVLGGRCTFADAKQARSYDVLSLSNSGKWQNEIPASGKSWGPESGVASAPAWKDEVWGLRDAEGNTRPNWTVYGTFSLGGKFGHDPDSDAFYFYAGRSTFRYYPKSREWIDLKRRRGPEWEYPGTLLWSSMSYDKEAKSFILFGGGNLQSSRGDPGTWSFAPEGGSWEQIETKGAPPARANSRLVYDPVHRVSILFGGDQLNQLAADTWLFDSAKKTWVEQKPALSPSPRGGHAFLWLPKVKKTLMLGGYTYTSTTDYCASLYKTLPLEAWTYDVSTNRWELIARWEKDGPLGPANSFLAAAVDENDNVLLLDSQNRAWTCRFDLSNTDAGGTTKFGVEPGAMVRRTGSHDPKWYTEGRPAPDVKAVAERLEKLPVNEWVLLPTPNAPKMNMDWGSAVFDTANDKIVRFSGGHSAYSGTAPTIYDVKTDRYSLPFAPEYPVEFVYGNDQVRGEWSFQGNPWMTGHTYKTTGYDPNLKAMMFVGHTYAYYFDALTGKWSRLPGKNDFKADYYTNTVCTTSDGAVVWAQQLDGSGPWIWRFNPATMDWKPLPIVINPRLPVMSPDHHGMTFDSKRNRLLFFSDLGPKRGNIASYDLKSFALKWVGPCGADRALAPCRETIYIPEVDMVLIGARVKDTDGTWMWLAYNCAENEWVGIQFGGIDPIAKQNNAFNNSMGLMYDPIRKLIWAVGQHSEVYALKLDISRAKVKSLK